MIFENYYKKVANGEHLAAEESEEAFNAILDGDATEGLVYAFLAAMHRNEENYEEVLGAVKALRSRMTVFPGAENAIDVCGTGGDSQGTLNVSTAVAFVLAGAGSKVAKHGNRAVSSRSGSSDILSALGIKIDVSANIMRKAFDEANLCFLHAPIYHPAMKRVAAIRAELRHRTIFNLVGPLVNPANVRRQLVGVYDNKWLKPFADLLETLGSDHIGVVHGRDGLDEITTTTDTDMVMYIEGKQFPLSIHPSEYNISVAQPIKIKGGNVDFNAERLIELLQGNKNAYRDIVLMNSAIALLVDFKSDRTKATFVERVQSCLEIAKDSIDSGKAKAALEKLIQITNE